MRKPLAGLAVLVLLLVFTALTQAQSGGRLITQAELAGGVRVTAWAERFDPSTGVMFNAVLMDQKSSIQISADRATFNHIAKEWSLEGNVRISAATGGFAILGTTSPEFRRGLVPVAPQPAR